MPPHNVLITGASGYLGGSLMARLQAAATTTTTTTTELPPCGTVYALVRTPEQADIVRARYGAEPLTFDVHDEAAVRDAVLRHRLSVVFFLIDALRGTAQRHFIRALAALRQQQQQEQQQGEEVVSDVHFLHTSGAKVFSSHSGAPTNRPLLDSDPELWGIQKAQQPPVAMMKEAIETNNHVMEESDKLGVRAYIFSPCIVYGEGLGFGNRISIQTTAIVKAAKAAGAVYRVDSDSDSDSSHPAVWPVCHIEDNTSVFVSLLRQILLSSSPSSPDQAPPPAPTPPPPHGRGDPTTSRPGGYYLAASGSLPWDDLYAAVATALHRRGVIASKEVKSVPPPSSSSSKEDHDRIADAMARGLGTPREFTALQIGGRCTLEARNAREALGWEPRYGVGHAVEAADDEVERILGHLSG